MHLKAVKALFSLGNFACTLIFFKMNHLGLTVFILLLTVIQSLIALVNDPQPEHPLRADLAEEYSKDRKKFCKNAEEFTKKYGEKRPVD